eukprot:TRINITY_DN1964_c0_g1_i1.p2 TRINITY_DN1964_c0_g1~~TRINITY_DN1964_c0_g1_i1.p2  ORF type:complete len:119 (-),score=11.18 TRINITY_DN1964_c0_g1_i1:27-383(-)
MHVGVGVGEWTKAATMEGCSGNWMQEKMATKWSMRIPQLHQASAIDSDRVSHSSLGTYICRLVYGILNVNGEQVHLETSDSMTQAGSCSPCVAATECELQFGRQQQRPLPAMLAHPLP